MKALYFDGLPQDIEQIKTENPSRVTIMGSPVYGAEVFASLLKYGTFDQLFVPVVARQSAGDVRDSKIFAANRDRICFVTEYELSKMRVFNRAAFLTPWIDLPNMARLRRLSGLTASPVTGIIHSINYSTGLRFALLLLLSPLESFDALICSSTAGRAGISRLFDLVAGRMARRNWPELRAKFKTPMIPLGVDTDRFSAANGAEGRAALGISRGPVVLYFGRFSASSKADLFPLILAAGRLDAEIRDLTLVLAGDDTHYEMAEGLRQFAAQVHPGLSILVEPNPTLDRKLAMYSAADVFVSPSDNLQETFGITVVEAMSAALPAVVSDWDGYKDLVVDGETGFRIPTAMPSFPRRFDDLRGSGEMLQPDLLAATTIVDVDALTHRIRQLVINPELRKRMGQQARLRAQRLYDWKAVIAAYEELWEELSEDAERQQANNEPFDLEQFGYMDIFSHYPTECLDSSTRVALTDVALTGRHGHDLLKKTPGCATWFCDRMFESMLDYLRLHPGAEFRNVISPLTDGTEMGEILATAHLARLIKYGLVRIQRKAATVS